MLKNNRYGLTRNIPDPIKRLVRQKCGFGCVICGAIPFTYHHFDPTFRDAKTHNPDGIALLCPNHHSEAESGLLPNDIIRKKVQEPKSLENGFSCYTLRVGDKFPVIILGNATFIGNPTLIKAFGKPLFSVDKPEKTGAPFRINAIFYDAKGNQACRIMQNELLSLAKNWDITFIHKTITIRRAPQEIILKMRINPPNELVIDRLNMFYKGFRIVVDESRKTTTFLPDGRIWFTLEDKPIFEDNNAVIVIE